MLDQELGFLPEKYRLPVVLCDLEGKSIREATRQLGWPQGTLAGRLARGRTMLAKRLARRGIALSGGSLAVVLSQKGMAAVVPPKLLISTAEAAKAFTAGKVAGVVSPKAATLAKGVLKAMLLTKLKSVTPILFLLGLLSASAGTMSYSARAGDQAANVQDTNKPEPAPVGQKADFTIKVEGNRVAIEGADFRASPRRQITNLKWDC